ncbi:hypothetical protein [Arthrobacter burdickii]|uniref:Lipoprotein n=1 Tax=Arthrobacter burdickii TaxID=3035920 RepID=A0ABT8K0E3_9MICC|nr:hypothetical protein [Arthrobacter burdickii]MDN4610900.1 hypothetical protein [Arthrobacter burdickii]
MERRSSLGAAGAALLAAGLLAGCSAPEPSNNDALSAFSSIEEAYAAVDGVLACEAEPGGEPIVPADGAALTSEQRLCAENVQIDLYPDEAALAKGFEIWSGSHQGEVQLVRGSNWMVVDVTGVATGQPTTWDIERLAGELKGDYSVVGT